MTEIGIAHLHYDEEGKLIRTTFMSTMELTVNDDLLHSFVKVDCTEGDEAVANQANNVFAAWFQRNNDIELADREKYQIRTEIAAPCERYENGKIKLCSVKFIFDEIT